MWLLFNHYRRDAKVLVGDGIKCILLLMVIAIFISAVTKTLLSPWMSVLGIVWLPAMAWAIYKNGGLIVDSLIVANFLGLKVGEEFTDALVAVFLIQALIVVFGLVVPIWESWALFLALLIFLIGAILATIADKESPLRWKKISYYVLWAGVATLTVAIFVSFISGGISLGRSDFFINKRMLKVLIFGLLFLSLGLIPKVPFKKALLTIGFLMVLGCAGMYVFGQDAKEALAENLPQVGQKMASANIVSTGYTLAKGERLVITRLNMAKPAPISAFKITPDGQKSGWETWPKPTDTWWGIGNTGVQEGFTVSLKLPRGLTLSDLALNKIKIPENNGANGNGTNKPPCPLGEKGNNHQAQPNQNLEIIS